MLISLFFREINTISSHCAIPLQYIVRSLGGRLLFQYQYPEPVWVTSCRPSSSASNRVTLPVLRFTGLATPLTRSLLLLHQPGRTFSLSNKGVDRLNSPHHGQRRSETQQTQNERQVGTPSLPRRHGNGRLRAPFDAQLPRCCTAPRDVV